MIEAQVKAQQEAQELFEKGVFADEEKKAEEEKKMQGAVVMKGSKKKRDPIEEDQTPDEIPMINIPELEELQTIPDVDTEMT